MEEFASDRQSTEEESKNSCGRRKNKWKNLASDRQSTEEESKRAAGRRGKWKNMVPEQHSRDLCGIDARENCGCTGPGSPCGETSALRGILRQHGMPVITHKTCVKACRLRWRQFHRSGRLSRIKRACKRVDCIGDNFIDQVGLPA